MRFSHGAGVRPILLCPRRHDAQLPGHTLVCMHVHRYLRGHGTYKYILAGCRMLASMSAHTRRMRQLQLRPTL